MSKLQNKTLYVTWREYSNLRYAAADGTLDTALETHSATGATNLVVDNTVAKPSSTRSVIACARSIDELRASADRIRACRSRPHDAEFSELRLIEHTGELSREDDETLPYRLSVNLRPPSLMRVAFVGLYGGSEKIVCRSSCRDALDEFIDRNRLAVHPRLRRLELDYTPEVDS